MRRASCPPHFSFLPEITPQTRLNGPEIQSDVPCPARSHPYFYGANLQCVGILARALHAKVSESFIHLFMETACSLPSSPCCAMASFVWRKLLRPAISPVLR